MLGKERVTVRKFASQNKCLAGVSLVAIVVAILAGASTMLGLGQASATSGVTGAEAPPPLVDYQAASGPVLSDEKIAGVAQAEATAAGENAPSMSAVDTTFKSALETSQGAHAGTSVGMEAFGKSEVVVVVLHGHFVLNDVPIPKRATAPTGSVLTLVIDAHTGWVDSRELTDAQASGVAALGTARMLQ